MPEPPLNIESKVQEDCRHQIAQVINKFPLEIRDRILCYVLCGIQKGSKNKTYEVLRNASRLCKRVFGNKESKKLPTDHEIKRYIRRTKEFVKCFGTCGITFGGLYLLQITMPTDSSLSKALGLTLAMSSVTHLNLHCGENPRFIVDISRPEWANALGRLKILRIKYICSLEENNGEDYPWKHPLWVSTLSSCASLEAFFLKTPLPIVNDDDNDDSANNADSMETIIDCWTDQMPLLQRLYIFHGYDEDAGIGDQWWIGSYQLFRLKTAIGFPVTAYSPSKWNAIDVRPEGFADRLPFNPYRSISVLKDDLDPYNSDAE
ncbi:hypothetical protein GALMADRAFT_138567 [Galerina marginata CBS 339.88]|uniref:Uncharacterized protein n=1 Tax=Galerina marginata (strain CBS 339.88) TaxID=685588 RepID=A0A067T2T5_GALM3|nr:hypothetical protein GALMADRAFT_138567 [Galerina marginata CBS 339.88]